MQDLDALKEECNAQLEGTHQANEELHKMQELVDRQAAELQQWASEQNQLVPRQELDQLRTESSCLLYTSDAADE